MPCKPVGSVEAAFRDLAPYIFRVAISNNRSVKLEDGHVTFSTSHWARIRLHPLRCLLKHAFVGCFSMGYLTDASKCDMTLPKPWEPSRAH